MGGLRLPFKHYLSGLNSRLDKQCLWARAHRGWVTIVFSEVYYVNVSNKKAEQTMHTTIQN